MRNLIICILILGVLALPASAAEITAPEVPDSAAERMPDTESFGEGLWELFQSALQALYPYLTEASRVSLSVIAASMMIAVVKTFSDPVKKTAELAGTTAVAAILLLSANSMIRLGADTVVEISEYGKLLLPVMTAAMAAQGGVTASAALYTGTAVFNTLLGNMISRLFVPMVYLFLALAAAGSAIGEDALKRLRDLIKNSISWCLKTLLTVFTTYMSITGVVSGTTDAAALKTAKVTISSVVPVVGGILSDASESVLVSAGLIKNAAGVYGILAVLAVFLLPFLRIGTQYMLLKLTASVCGIFSPKSMTELIGDFSSAMGLLLAMTGAVCLLQLISTVCFMKGVG